MNEKDSPVLGLHVEGPYLNPKRAGEQFAGAQEEKGEGGEIALSPGRSLFAFLAKMQDEVHRFAIGYHHSRRSKNTFKSSLTGIEGIGEVRARSLLKYFRTIENISNADLAELENAPKMTKDAALAVYKYYHPQDENETE